MPRYFYYSGIQTFLNESDDQIFGKLAGRDEYDLLVRKRTLGLKKLS
jgi:hypothetical protein